MPSWGELLNELQDQTLENGSIKKALSLDELRIKYLDSLSKITGRNVIAYYSAWLKGRTDNIDINDSDLTGFMNALNAMDCSKGLDLILHTPGGNPTSTEGIVKYLHKKFGNDIRVIVPQMAMFAGTMLACSSREIVMGAHSCLGPIDPQFSGIPAYNIISEFREAKADLDLHENTKTYWELQLKKYPAAFFYSVMDAIKLSSELVDNWLQEYMFYNISKTEAKKKTKHILSKLNANNKSHSRHFSIDFCKEIGLNIMELETDQALQDAVLSVHHSFIITIDATNTSKIIENNLGARYITSQRV